MEKDYERPIWCCFSLSNLLGKLNVCKQEHRGIVLAELFLKTVVHIEVHCVQQLNFQDAAEKVKFTIIKTGTVL